MLLTLFNKVNNIVSLFGIYRNPIAQLSLAEQPTMAIRKTKRGGWHQLLTSSKRLECKVRDEYYFFSLNDFSICEISSLKPLSVLSRFSTRLQLWITVL